MHDKIQAVNAAVADSGPDATTSTNTVDVIEAEPETEALPSTAAAVPESLTESQPNATMIDEAVPALGTSNNTVDDIEAEPDGSVI